MWIKIDEVVGNNLKKIRLERNITQQALANKANLSKQSISNIESGKGANSKTMERLAECLEVSPLAFYQDIDFKENIKLKRVTHKDTTTDFAADFDTTHYVEEITQTVKNIIAATKKSLYLSSVLPTIQQTFSQNMDIVLKAMHAYSNPENRKIMMIFRNILISNIEKVIFIESEKQDKKLKKDKNIDTILEDEILEMKDIPKKTYPTKVYFVTSDRNDVTEYKSIESTDNIVKDNTINTTKKETPIEKSTENITEDNTSNNKNKSNFLSQFNFDTLYPDEE